MIISDSSKAFDSRNFGEECFEFDMASNKSKDLKSGWEWEDFKGSVGSYQRFGLDPYEYHIPNAVAFTHDPTVLQSRLFSPLLEENCKWICANKQTC